MRKDTTPPEAALKEQLSKEIKKLWIAKAFFGALALFTLWFMYASFNYETSLRNEIREQNKTIAELAAHNERLNELLKTYEVSVGK